MGHKKWNRMAVDMMTCFKENPEVLAEYHRLVLEGVEDRIGSTADGDLHAMLPKNRPWQK